MGGEGSRGRVGHEGVFLHGDHVTHAGVEESQSSTVREAGGDEHELQFALTGTSTSTGCSQATACTATGRNEGRG
jgi:hypothetical protein